LHDFLPLTDHIDTLRNIAQDLRLSISGAQSREPDCLIDADRQIKSLAAQLVFGTGVTE
jgi:hypothetical protein